MHPAEKPLTIGEHSFNSRLFLGTGKYQTNELMVDCLEASGTELVTVAVRRVDLSDKSDASFLNHIDLEKYKLLPNTAGCYTAKDALRTARLAREALDCDLIKLEVLADEKTLLPEPIHTLEAAEILVKEGFTVMVYTSDDPILARRLADVGVASVMPAGSPIGSGQGVLNPNNIRIILETIDLPIIIDAGVGTASDAAFAMELGVDGVLLNTAVAGARDPLCMAQAMRDAVIAGRRAAFAGRIPKKLYAHASSPMDGLMKPSARNS
ncbi:MAG: thiazole synthase [Planctomycetota bacterium]|jgi:thiazole synthase